MKTSLAPAVQRRFAMGALRVFFLAVALVFAGACTAPTPERAPDESVGTTAQPLVKAFASGALVIPMDTTFQDNGTLRAFGLVYELLLNNVPVSWAILPGKAQDGIDFTITAPATIKNLESNAVVPVPSSYRGGPFIVDAADRAAALPIINAWLASDAVTVVHDVTGTFSADIERTMTAAPRIAIFQDGNQTIAYNDLNAAGIRDSAGNTWTDASPTTFTEAEIIGPTTTNDADGALFGPGGVPAFCHITSHHYVATASTNEVVQEFRSFLDYGPTTHTFMECAASETFESNANGHFLTTNGIVDDGNPSNNPTNRFPDDPLTQFVGGLDIDTGTVDSIGLAAASAFRPTVKTLINNNASATTARIVWMSGKMNGDAANGTVTYLAGHDYTTTVPISANPLTNGVRLFLNSLFETPCTNATMQPVVTFTKSAPATVSGSTITFTFNYANAGPGVATSAVITDVLPAGTTFVSATNGGTNAANTVTWNLGPIGAGANGTVSVDVSVAADGTYANQGTLTYKSGNTTKTMLSNTTSTTRGAGADLALTLTDSPDPVQGGSNITYTASVTNNGPAASGALTITDVLPAGTTLVSATGTGWTCTGTTTVTCTNTGIGASTASSVTIIVSTANANATITNTVTVAGAATDPNAANNSATATTTVTTGVIPDAGPDASAQDTDGDGITDGAEIALGLNPNDADSDDDGVIDGQEPSFSADTDGDGAINALDADSDNDGLFDGTELGLPCTNPATNLAFGRCIPDGDAGATKTNPLVRDTDGGGATDGSEDVNRNGVVDAGERNPTVGNGADDVAVGDAGNGDADGDGLSDAFERAIGSNPNDADTDDDGLTDGLEANPAEDTDGDGVINILDVDSDNDGLYDGTELGKNCSNPATDATKKHCIADADPATTTSPLLKDTDGGGAGDGSEDANLNGKVDNGETNPAKGNGADDSKVIDTDKDGLSDALEKFLKSNPNDADTDDDGALDGAEANPADDTDGDGLRNVLDVDSDNDGLYDGTE
ncbi:MAG: sdr, partial [Myxococcaceae bacterium]|nr:sdr [Myxococcaceae bacterium]